MSDLSTLQANAIGMSFSDPEIDLAPREAPTSTPRYSRRLSDKMLIAFHGA
jgi:hypothetical protein